MGVYDPRWVYVAHSVAVCRALEIWLAPLIVGEVADAFVIRRTPIPALWGNIPRSDWR
jgi:hypothetical protein